MTLDINDFHNVPYVFDDPKHTRAHDARKEELVWCLDNYVPKNGVVLEFGVYEGKTLRHMAEYRPDVKFYGFDSFEGLPEDWDTGEKYITKDRFNVDNLPSMPDNVKLVKGFFDETLIDWSADFYENGNRNIDFINIDSDLYSSATIILDVLDTFITTNTLLRFDELCEWRIEPFYTKKQQIKDRRIPQGKYTKWEEGEWKALNEWVEEYDREVKPVARNYSQSSVMEIVK